ncbi:uncharacterized protein SCHCODRAFT_02536603 [Schizophyllum commune H4-8]|nr:uncharacterized protein SCHCODRAFT_02536603 [Schizophyllum commune H4-8]KAI5895488.1 hypothetical protein SCHCODRAFT_02536603 [Schizophyllum commune H4-8]
MTSPGLDACYVNRISVELLEAIFLYVSQSIFSMVTTRVCRYWREITLNSPRLWTEIRMEGRLTEGQVQLVRAALSRSLPYPLCIRITEDAFVQTSEDLQVWKEAFDHAGRWEEAELMLPRSAEMLVDIEEIDAPRLRALTLSVPDGEEVEDENADEDVNDLKGPPEWQFVAPALKQVKLSGSYFDYKARLPLPFEQLSDLRLQLAEDAGSVEEVIDILRPCSLLTHLALDILHWDDEAAPPTPLTLPALKTLDINNAGTEIGRYLKAPALRKVIFRMEGVDFGDPARYANTELDALLALAQKCTFTSLTLRIQALADDDSWDVLEEVLGEISEVTELEVWEGLGMENAVIRTSIMADVYRILAYNKPWPPALPSLTRLSTHSRIVDLFPTYFREVQGMVTSRRMPDAECSPLQYLEISQDPHPNFTWGVYSRGKNLMKEEYWFEEQPAGFKWMLKMREEGLEVKSDLLDRYIAYHDRADRS